MSMGDGGWGIGDGALERKRPLSIAVIPTIDQYGSEAG